MGCNCKKARRVQNKLGFRIKESSNGILPRIFQGLIILAVLTIILPFVLIYLYINYILVGSLELRLPKTLLNRMV